MVSQEIRTNAAALGVLMHQVNQEQAEMLRLVKTNLVAAADHAEELERSLVVPRPEETRTAASAEKSEEQHIARGLTIAFATLLPKDCTGECEGCSHAKHEETV